MRAWDRLAGMAMGAAKRTFGQPVQWHPLASAPEWAEQPADQRTVVGVFDPHHKLEETDGHATVSAVVPRLELAGKDLPAEPEQGDQAVIDGQTYAVRDVQPDGAGNFALILAKGQGARLRW